MLILRQSTSIDIRMGPFVDAVNGVTPETGITLGAADQAEVLKENGAATVTMAGAFVAITGADGWYDYTVAVGDVDTVGEVVFVVQDESISLPIYVRAFVVEEAVYDASYDAGSAGPLQGTTPGNTLDVSATGEAGIDWANIGSPTTAQNLSGTNIDVDQIVASVSGAVGSVTAAVTVDTINADVINAASIAAAAMNGKGDWNIGKTGYSLTQSFPANFADLSIVVTTGLVDITQAAADKAWATAVRILTASTNFNDIAATDIVSSGAITTLAGAVVNVDTVDSVTGAVGSVTGAVGSVAGNVDGNVTGSVGSVATGGIVATSFAAGAIDAAAIATDAIGAAELASDAVDKIRDAILPTQNAAFDNIPFLFVAASDHVTPVTGATGMAVTRSINAGAFGAGTGTLAEIGNGMYQYDASAADMNGGIIIFRFTATGGTPGAPDDTFVPVVTGGGV